MADLAINRDRKPAKHIYVWILGFAVVLFVLPYILMPVIYRWQTPSVIENSKLKINVPYYEWYPIAENSRHMSVTNIKYEFSIQFDEMASYVQVIERDKKDLNTRHKKYDEVRYIVGGKEIDGIKFLSPVPGDGGKKTEIIELAYDPELAISALLIVDEDYNKRLSLFKQFLNYNVECID